MSETAHAMQPSPGQPDDLPQAFGDYLLFDRIGQGGMAEIYLARARTGLGGSRHVVVKRILPHLSNDPGFSDMLVAEAKLAAQLRHGNVVQVIDLGRESERLFITMEYVEGYDLHQLLRELSRKRLPLPAEFVFFIVREVLAALDYAHRAASATGEPLGIVHRDISPSNVLISFEGEVKLCDFGIARASGMRALSRVPDQACATEEASRIQRARVAGKSAYMAPEHARGFEIDERADLFAAGILLWELCAGRRLYKGAEAEMLEMAKTGDVPALPDRGLPRHDLLQQLLDKALAVDPASRFQSAGEMLQALDGYLMDSRLHASQLRFAGFLTEHFADQIIEKRRARERAAEATLGSVRGAAASSEATADADPPKRESIQVDRRPARVRRLWLVLAGAVLAASGAAALVRYL